MRRQILYSMLNMPYVISTQKFVVNVKYAMKINA